MSAVRGEPSTSLPRIYPGLLLEPVRLARSGPADPLVRAGSARRDDLVDHVARLGGRPYGGRWLLDVVEECSVKGHGGGFFPAARKWRSAMVSSQPVTLVANAAESEPLSAKDATLVRQRPHLVLDGLVLAAETLGAGRVVVWLHDCDTLTRAAVEQALRERRVAGRAGGRAEHDVMVMTSPGTYLAGESSAIARGLSGGPVLPMFREFGAHARGQDGDAMVVVHNVETLARVALLAREAVLGPLADGWPGLPTEPLTTLLTVLTPTHRRVVEAWSTTTMREVLAGASWPEFVVPSAVLLGGYGGMWARWSDIADLEVREPALRERGHSLGAGIVAPLPPHLCGVAETASVVGYLAASSARQCGPCLFGLDAIAAGLDRLRWGRAGRSSLRRVVNDLELVRGRGACHHPDGAVRLVSSMLAVFVDDVHRHASGRPCRNAGATAFPVPAI